MNRIGIVILAVALSLCAVVVPSSHVYASVDNFHFSNFTADYYLTKDSEGRSSLKVIEQLTAVFPVFDQNKGIERAIPAVYDGHSVSFKLESLTRNGQPEPVYSQTTVSNNVVIGTGTDQYVHGVQNYQFTYSLRDVTKDFGDHQELYWDTNGTEWRQYFDQVSARVHIDSSIQAAFTGDVKCYEGLAGSSRECSADKSDKLVTLTSNGTLQAGENVTAVLKFNKATFASRPFSAVDLLAYIPFVMFGLAIIMAIFVWMKYGRNAKGRGTIIPEYLPPKNISVILAGELYGATSKSVTAQIIDLAVRHNIRVIESEVTGLFGGKSSEYTIELLNTSGLSEIEQKVITDLFGSLEVGQKYTFKKTDTTVGMSLRGTLSSVAKMATNEGYRQANKGAVALLVTAIIAIIVVLIIIFVSMDGEVVGIVGGASIVAGFIAILVLSLVTASMRPLTDSGREVYDYLKGLEMYITLAEADRIRVLQSPTGADKTPVNTDDTAQIVKLYERVLPYAVLFGLEKEWSKELAIHYEQTNSQPNWYSGSSAFNAAIFASSIGNFASTATSFSSPTNSSSSGFGGGFSGGGGGGGGGGGR